MFKYSILQLFYECLILVMECVAECVIIKRMYCRYCFTLCSVLFLEDDAARSDLGDDAVIFLYEIYIS